MPSSPRASFENSHSTRTPTCPMPDPRQRNDTEFHSRSRSGLLIRTPEDRSDSEEPRHEGVERIRYYAEPPIGAFVSTRMRTQSLVFSARTKIQSRSNEGARLLLRGCPISTQKTRPVSVKPRARFTNLTHSRPGRVTAELPASHTPIVHNKTTSCPLLP